MNEFEARAPYGFRQPPHSIDAEQALLGAIIVNNEAYHRVAAFLRHDHFYEPVHGRIFAAMQRLIEDGRVADHVTMAEAFAEDEALKELQGAKYLAQMALAAETLLNAEDYGKHIHDLALKRGVIRVAEDAVNKAYDGTYEPSGREQIEGIRGMLDNLEAEERHTGWRHISESLNAIIDRLHCPHAILSTGLAQLDESMAGGLHSGTVYGFEGRSKQFKSGTMGTILLSLIKQEAPTFYFALEMGDCRILERLVSRETHTNAVRFRRREDPDDLVGRVDTFTHQYGRMPVYFANEPRIHFDRLRAMAREAIQKLGIRVMFVDYWQLVSGAGKAGRAQHLTDVAQWCAEFAQRHDIAMVLASQANREHESYMGDGLMKSCDWLAQQHKVDWKSISGKDELIWMQIRANRDGPDHDIGSADCPAFRIDKVGPVLAPWAP